MGKEEFVGEWVIQGLTTRTWFIRCKLSVKFWGDRRAGDGPSKLQDCILHPLTWTITQRDRYEAQEKDGSWGSDLDSGGELA